MTRRPVVQLAAAAGVTGDLRDQAAVVVVENRQRNLPEEGKGMDVTIRPRLRRRRRVGPDETDIALWQVHHKEMGFVLDAPDDRHRLAKIRHRVTRRVGKRHEHLVVALFAFPDIIPHDGVAAGEAMLVPQPVKYTLRRMALLGQHLLVVLEPPFDDRDEAFQFRPSNRLLAPVTRRSRKLQHLAHALARNVEIASRS